MTCGRLARRHLVRRHPAQSVYLCCYVSKLRVPVTKNLEYDIPTLTVAWSYSAGTGTSIGTITLQTPIINQLLGSRTLET